MSMNPNLNMDWINNPNLNESDLMGISENCGYDVLLGANNGEEPRRAYGTVKWPNDQEINSLVPEKDEEEPETEPECLTFTALEDSSIGIRLIQDFSTIERGNFEYSLDNGENWEEYLWDDDNNGEIISLSSGDVIKFRGNNPCLSKYHVSGSSYHQFKMTGRINASGDVTSLLNNIGGDVPMPTEGYFGMCNLFRDCTSLVEAPSLPSTNLSEYCYNDMFKGCTSLTKTPELPATTLAEYCYSYMFNGCTSLTTAPELPATTLAKSCYFSMFLNCINLITISELPATTMAESCYSGMFGNCTSLTTAPELPATTLVDRCYGAVEMMPGVYMLNGMFEGCSSLNYIKAMFTTEPSGTYLAKWVTGVSENGTFVMNSAAEWNPEDYRGDNGIPVGWTVITNQ